MKKNNKKVPKVVASLVVIVTICLSYSGIMYYNFKNAERSTDVNNIDAKPQRLTIIYRKGCSRCKKILPKLILEKGFSKNLSPDQLEKYDVEITPTFRLNGESYNTTNMKIIDKLWKISK